MQRNLDIPTPDANSVFTMSQPHHAALSPISWIGLLGLVLSLVGLLLLRRRALNPLSQPPTPVDPGMDTLVPERERILKMLDDGKITAQESADLLNALGHAASACPIRPAPAVRTHHRLALVGGALLLIGFFLPWFSVLNIGNELSRRMGSMQQSMGLSFGMPNDPGLKPEYRHDQYRGRRHRTWHWGWIILLLGLAAAVLPYGRHQSGSPRPVAVTVAVLSLGVIILLYLLSDSLRFASVGILLVLAGYALQFIGILKQRPMLQR